jgi:tight adherence protein C
MPSFINQQTLVLFGIFATSVLIVFGLASLVFSRDQVSKRMSGSGRRSAAGAASQSLQFDDRASKWANLLAPINKKMGPKKTEVRSTVRKQLIRAGNYSHTATEIYFALRIVLAVAVPILALVLARLLLGNPSSNVILLAIVGGAIFGFYLPLLYVHAQIQKRQQAVREGLPDALDLLLVCVEAGSSLAGGFRRVGDELEKIHPIVSEQLLLISFELQAGVGRADSLRNFATRIEIEEVKSLTTLLIQSEQLGTSLARALRVYAEEMRGMRMIRAEEMANKLPVKLSLPLVLFILPCLMMVIMTPLAIRILRVLLQT